MLRSGRDGTRRGSRHRQRRDRAGDRERAPALQVTARRCVRRTRWRSRGAMQRACRSRNVALRARQLVRAAGRPALRRRSPRIRPTSRAAIPTSPPDVRRFEPEIALISGATGLEAIEQIVAQAAGASDSRAAGWSWSTAGNRPARCATGLCAEASLTYARTPIWPATNA